MTSSFHPENPADGTLSVFEVSVALSHSLTQGAAVFLFGLVTFTAFVWRAEPDSPEYRTFRLGALSFFVLLLVAGTLELCLFTVRASGESLSPALLREAVFETRTGTLWMLGLGLGLLVTLALIRTLQTDFPVYRSVALTLGGLLAATLIAQSHASGAFATALTWLHVVAASVWMGGLAGFPLLLFARRRAPEGRPTKSFERAVGRFTKLATASVATLLVTGVYASLSNIPDLDALLYTAYGRALTMKIGLLFIVLPIGAINSFDRGGEPLGRMACAELVLAFLIFTATGFLSTLPPPG